MQEAAATRRVLERVPEDKLSWKPHSKSMSLGQLALHIAGLPGALAEMLSVLTQELPTVPLPEATSLAQILALLDQSVSLATAKLAAWDEHDLIAEWKLTRGTETVVSLPRIVGVRQLMLNHWYHHRGQLVVYIRLLDVPVPAIYGPTADEGN